MSLAGLRTHTYKRGEARHAQDFEGSRVDRVEGRTDLSTGKPQSYIWFWRVFLVEMPARRYGTTVKVALEEAQSPSRIEDRTFRR